MLKPVRSALLVTVGLAVLAAAPVAGERDSLLETHARREHWRAEGICPCQATAVGVVCDGRFLYRLEESVPPRVHSSRRGDETLKRLHQRFPALKYRIRISGLDPGGEPALRAAFVRAAKTHLEALGISAGAMDAPDSRPPIVVTLEQQLELRLADASPSIYVEVEPVGDVELSRPTSDGRFTALESALRSARPLARCGPVRARPKR